MVLDDSSIHSITLFSRQIQLGFYDMPTLETFIVATNEKRIVCGLAENLCGFPANPVQLHQRIFHRVEVQQQTGPNRVIRRL